MQVPVSVSYVSDNTLVPLFTSEDDSGGYLLRSLTLVLADGPVKADNEHGWILRVGRLGVSGEFTGDFEIDLAPQGIPQLTKITLPTTLLFPGGTIAAVQFRMKGRPAPLENLYLISRYRAVRG